MPAPTIAQVAYGWAQRTSVQFGGKGVPIGKNLGGNLSMVDLNDGVNYFAQGLIIPDAKQIQTVQQLWRAKAAYLSEDYNALTVTLKMVFEEGGGKTLASERAKLLTAGEQFLTFDGSATAFSAKCKSWGSPTAKREGVPPLSWDCDLSFLVPEPFLIDVSGSTTGAIATPGSTGGGTVTNPSVSYLGSFLAEPKFVVTTINAGGNLTCTIANTDSGETLTFTAPANGNVYTVDSSNLKITDQNGVFYDPTGSFPMLWPKATGNAFSITMVSAAGAHTTTVNWNNRWMP